MGANMKIVVMSDTHGEHRRMVYKNMLPKEADLLIHCGDFTNMGAPTEWTDFNKWLRGLPYKHKVVVCGNHDEFGWAGRDPSYQITNAIYLDGESVEIEGIKIFGLSATDIFWHNEQIDALLFEDNPMPDCDILVTHVGPYGVLDQIPRRFGKDVFSESIGSPSVKEQVLRVKPKVHCFGHCHEHFGALQLDETKFINASLLDRDYRMTRAPLIFDL